MGKQIVNLSVTEELFFDALGIIRILLRWERFDALRVTSPILLHWPWALLWNFDPSACRGLATRVNIAFSNVVPHTWWALIPNARGSPVGFSSLGNRHCNQREKGWSAWVLLPGHGLLVSCQEPTRPKQHNVPLSLQIDWVNTRS